MPQKYRIFPLFIPFLGCKNKCVFCEQRSITATNISDIEVEIKTKLEELKEPVNEIAFYGGSFTGLNQDLQERLLKLVNLKMNNQIIIRISTYPEYIDIKLLKMLYQYNVRIIELGVQSLNAEVLKKSGRNYEIETVKKASALIKSFGFKLGHQIMIGLPSATSETEIDTIEKIKTMNPDFLRIYPLVVIKNTELEKMYLNGDYKPLKLDEIIDRCVLILEQLENTNIKIIRIGLHSETAFINNSIVETNSYHPALGELVKSEYIFRKIKKIKNNCNFEKIKIKYPLNFQSVIFGNKKIYLEKYKKIGIDNFEIISDYNNNAVFLYSFDNNKAPIAEIQYNF